MCHYTKAGRQCAIYKARLTEYKLLMPAIGTCSVMKEGDWLQGVGDLSAC